MEKYAADIIRKRSSSPKFQVHNSALISSQRHELFNEIHLKPAEWGRIVESAIGAFLINSAQEQSFNLYYWRDRNEEIDFVIEKRGKVVAIEVKTGFESKTSGMKAFNDKFKPDRILLVGRMGMPWQKFLNLNLNELF